MRQLAALVLVGACVPVTKLEATSHGYLADTDSEARLTSRPADAAALVIEKLGARGFTLVSTWRTATGVRLKLAGNRDFAGIHTLGSVFYAWIEPADDGTHVKLVGQPTIDHVESCPQYAGEPTCRMIQTDLTWGVSGYEEAQVIRGVFAELALDAAASGAADAPNAPSAAGAATATDDARPAAALTLRGCGGAMRWASGGMRK